MPTREEIIAALAAQREHVEQWLRALPEAELLHPLTASEVEGGEMWTAKDHLAHAVGAERFFQGVINRAISGAEDPVGFYTQAGSDDPAAQRSVVNQLNERGASRFRDTSAAALFSRMGETREATLALLATLDDAQLAQPVAHSPFGDGTIGALFLQIARHFGQHMTWLDAAIAERDAQSK